MEYKPTLIIIAGPNGSGKIEKVYHQINDWAKDISDFIGDQDLKESPASLPGWIVDKLCFTGSGCKPTLDNLIGNQQIINNQKECGNSNIAKDFIFSDTGFQQFLIACQDADLFS